MEILIRYDVVSLGLQFLPYHSLLMSSLSRPRKSTLVNTGTTHSPSFAGKYFLVAKQDDLEIQVSAELEDAMWEVSAHQLARAISAKRQKSGVAFEGRDKLENYDIYLDRIPGSSIKDIVDLMEGFEPVGFRSERSHYTGIVNYFNHILESCLKSCLQCGVRGDYHANLRFYKYDLEVQDVVQNANPLKPDIVDIIDKQEPPALQVEEDEITLLDKLWWSPLPENSEFRLEIPVEVKSGSMNLISQAGTYARALFQAEPWRSFALAIIYNPTTKGLRFLVFHRGGLTMTPILKVIERQDKEGIAYLLCIMYLAVASGFRPPSLVHWKTCYPAHRDD